MTRTAISLMLCVVACPMLALAAPADAPAPPLPVANEAIRVPPGQTAALIQFTLYRVRGDISGETSLTDNIWEGVEGADPKAQARKGPYTFFTLAKETVAGVKFQADQNGWKWDGKDEPPPGSRVETVTRPRIIVVMPSSSDFVVQIGTRDPIQYFQKRPDGLFELHAVYKMTGLSISAKAEKGQAGRVLLRDLSIGTRLVEKRKPIEGVSLDVGEPIVSAKDHQVTVALKPNQDYGFLLLTDGMGALIGRLRVELKSQ